MLLFFGVFFHCFQSSYHYQHLHAVFDCILSLMKITGSGRKWRKEDWLINKYLPEMTGYAFVLKTVCFEWVYQNNIKPAISLSIVDQGNLVHCYALLVVSNPNRLKEMTNVCVVNRPWEVYAAMCRKISMFHSVTES